ncbi:MAG: beta strand repeat-containing protein, partial [Candidatus Nanopelagicaceae bacterium]
TVIIRATDARGDIETTTMTVRINDSVSVTGVTTLTTTYSIETSTQYVASGGTTSFTGGTDTYTFYVASITKGASTNIDTNTATIFIDSATGVLTILGTTLADTYTVIIRAIDQFSETGTLTLTLRVNESVSVTGDTELVTTEGRAWSTSAYQPSLGTGPYTYQVVKQENYAETYAGITISTNGIVTVDSAVVAADDTYTLYPVTIIATDSVGDSTTINLLIRVNDPVRIAGDAYLVTTASTPISSDSYTATLGTPDYTFSIAGITRWSGAADTSTISINASNGVVSTSANTPADTYTITVRVTDDRGDIEETTLVIRVNETLTLTGDTTIVTTYSRAITADFNAAGGTTADSGGENAYIFTINEIRKFDNSTIDTVAAGITIDPASGLLSVSETTPADTYTVTLRVTDSVSAFVQLLVTIRVNESVSVTGATTLTTTQGIAIDTQFSASLGTAPYTYQIVTSNLIDTVTGITISETGLVTVASSMVATDSSTPAVYPMTVIVTDAKGDTTTAAITITINPPIQITGDTYIVTTFGRAESSSAYQSSRGTVPHTFSIDAITDSANASRDPSSIGIAMSSNPGYLTISAATPADTYTVIIRVTDDRGDFETMSVTVLVNSAIAITGPTSLVTTFSIAVETTYAATGGTIEGRTSAGDLAFSIQSISAQNNSDTTSITISTNGELTITGTTPADTYTITILATDSLGVTGSLTVSLLVNEAVAATGDTELTTTEGRTWYTSQYIASKGTGSYTYSIATAADHSVTVDGITISDTGVVRVAETVTGADGSYTDYPMVVIITDQSGDSTTINLLIRVNDPVRIAGDAYLVTTASTPISSDSYTATLGTPDYTFSIAGITRWSGAADTSTISINASNGVVSTSANTPADTYTITVRVTDDRGDIEETTLVIRVNETLTLTGASTLITTAGREITSDYDATGGTTADSGGQNAYIFSIVSSPTDGGITIDASTGILTIASSVVADTYTVTIRVTDSVSAYVETVVMVYVNARTSVTGPSTLVTTEGFAIDTQFTATLGSAPYTYQIVRTSDSTTVAGITISETGLVRVADTVTAQGADYFDYVMAVIVTDSAGDATTALITITVNAPIRITGDTFIVTTFGRAETSTAYQPSRGTIPYTFSIDSVIKSGGGAGSGIAIGATSGLLTVSASTDPETYTVIVRVTDDRTDFETISVTVLVNPAITVTGATSITTTYSRSVETTYAATGGTIEGRGGVGQLLFSIQSITSDNSSDTSSISINSTSGVMTITGTTPADTYTITILATDSLGVTGSLSVSLLVNESVSITGDTELVTTEGISRATGSYVTSNGTIPRSITVINQDGTQVPNGISIDGNTLRVGSDLVAGTYYIYVVATDGVGDSATVAVTILVNETVTIGAASNIITTIGRVDSVVAFTPTRGTGTYTYAISSISPSASTDS